MDQLLPQSNSELPAPEKKTDFISGIEKNTETDHKPEAPVSKTDRLSNANDAVAQATYSLPSSADPVTTPQITSKNDYYTVGSQSPLIADDADVIEKEWVQKAKAIVNQTKEDPHRQSAELSNFKHDYMSKRYGKDIKLPDDQAV